MNSRIGNTLPGPDGEAYLVTEFLGRGAFGEVYRAEGTSSGRLVAAKFLAIEDFGESTARIALLNEIQFAKLISHPNVVRILAVSEGAPDTPDPFIMMEFAPDGSLEQVLREARRNRDLIPMERVKQMMSDVGRGAGAINERLVHRDIKPDNILLDGHTLKISDFGISKLVSHRTRSATFKGRQAIAYMAPEGWTRDENTPKMDIYSVGLVFYEIATLAHPLERSLPHSATIEDWRNAHLYMPCPNARDMRPELDEHTAQLLLRMVGKRAAERPSWEEVLETLSDSRKRVPQRAEISNIVRLATAQRLAGEEARLKAALAQAKLSQVAEMYKSSCENLLREFESITNEFNASYQGGQIAIQRGKVGARFVLPNGRDIQCSFFDAPSQGISIKGAHLGGGGFMRLESGPGANLLYLLEDGETYGRWMACFIGISGLVDPQAILGRRGLSTRTVLPFAFADQDDFYEEIHWANGGMHVFTYDLRKDTVDAFTELLQASFS